MKLLIRIISAALCVCITVLMCGCEFGSDENKVISMDVDTEPENIDPQLAFSDSELIIARNTMTGLFRVNESGEAEKSLCKSFTVSSDGLTYDFKIKDAKWSDNRKITADDFVFGIVRALTPETKSPYADTLFYIKNAEKFFGGEVNESQLGITAVDSITVRITLEKPISDIEHRLADIAAMPCNREFFNECKGKYGLSEDDMLYCGPFYVSSWSEKSIKMSRNGDYVGEKAKPSAITMTYGGTSEERIDDISKGIIDVAVIDAGDEPLAKSTGLKTSSLKGTVWTVIINPSSPIAGTELGSSALVKSLGRTEIESSLTSGYSNFSGIIAPDLTVCGEKYGNFVKEYTQQPMNAEEAKGEYMQALKENEGSMNGATLLYVDDGNMNNVAVKIAASWQSNLDAYINTEGVSLDEMKSRISSGNYTVALYPLGHGEYDAENVLRQFMTGNGGNIFGISDSEFDSLMQKAINEVSAEKKAEALHKAEQQLISGKYVCPIVLFPTVIAKTSTMTGCLFDLNRGNFDFANTGK